MPGGHHLLFGAALNAKQHPDFKPFSPEQARAADKAAVEAQLAQLEAHLAAAGTAAGAAPARLAGGDALSLADVSVACALLPLLRGVMGSEARAAYPKTCAWAVALAATPHFAKVLGACLLLVG